MPHCLAAWSLERSYTRQLRQQSFSSRHESASAAMAESFAGDREGTCGISSLQLEHCSMVHDSRMYFYEHLFLSRDFGRSRRKSFPNESVWNASVWCCL
jgi:hypothetical protein